MKQPNIIFILTDDQGAWALGASGNREIVTPQLDGLAASGIRCENFFCASPVCSPARASILTGRIPSQHGVHDWLRRGNLANNPPATGDGDVAIEYLRGQPAYTEILAEHGYSVGLAGKWHLGDSLTPQKGHSYWHVIPYGGSNYYNAPWIEDGIVRHDPGYLTDAITGHAMQFLELHKDQPKPFYLGVHYTAPHSPWDADQHPAELRQLYEDCPFESIPDLAEAHPWQINSAPRGRGARRRELLTGYYAAISGVDRGVGQILAWLEQHGLRENTLVIFTSDNGMNLGQHGLWGKGNATFPQNMYDSSVKVPFLISQPGTVPAGVVNSDLLSHYDLFPTLLDALALPNPEAGRLPGRSFAPMLRGLALGERSPLVVYDEYGPVRMIRGQRWKYVHRYPYGPHEFYDLRDDPGEAHNLLAGGAPISESIANLASEFKAQLDDWFTRYADPRLDGIREGVYGKGQLDLTGPGGQGRPAHATDWWYIDADGNRRET